VQTVTYKTESHQAIFDHVVRNLFDQGGPAVGTDTGCLYRMQLPDGKCRKCGMGWLIPDDEYDPAIENNAVLYGVINSGKNFGKRPEERPVAITIPENNIGLCRALQTAHDSGFERLDEEYRWLPRMVHNLHRVASAFGLDHKIVDETFGVVGSTLISA
jgi:hypothetical protein